MRCCHCCMVVPDEADIMQVPNLSICCFHHVVARSSCGYVSITLTVRPPHHGCPPKRHLNFAPREATATFVLEAGDLQSSNNARLFCCKVQAARQHSSLTGIHTREGYAPDLRDAGEVELRRSETAGAKTGFLGPLRRMLV